MRDRESASVRSFPVIRYLHQDWIQLCWPHCPGTSHCPCHQDGHSALREAAAESSWVQIHYSMNVFPPEALHFSLLGDSSLFPGFPSYLLFTSRSQDLNHFLFKAAPKGTLHCHHHHCRLSLYNTTFPLIKIGNSRPIILPSTFNFVSSISIPCWPL